MITGVHMIIYSKEAERVRALVGDILESRRVDAGRQEMYLMCDDIAVTMRELSAKGVEFEAEPADHGWGIVIAMKMPGGDRLWLYQPKHVTALGG